MLSKRVDVIINPSAGTDGKAEDEETVHLLEDAFARHSHVECRTHRCDGPEGFSAEAEKALAAGAETVVAAGGDGTVSCVARSLVHKDAALGILPLGTLNHLAKDLGIPEDLNEAVDVICADFTAVIDVGRVNDTYFMNNASVGFYPKLVTMRERLRPAVGKWPAMLAASLSILYRMPFVRTRIEWDGGSVLKRAPLIFIGNNVYETAWPKVGKRLGLNNGTLWLLYPKKTNVWTNIKAAWRALKGEMDAAAEVEAKELKKLTLRFRRKSISLGLDGEVVKLETPLVFEIVPDALKVKVPPKESREMPVETGLQSKE